MRALPFGNLWFRTLPALAAFLGAAVAPVASAQTAQQAVTVVVPQVEAMSVSQSALTLTFAAPSAAGGTFADVANSASTYALTVNTAANKITGQLDGAYEAGITLSVALAAPAGATSQGARALGVAPVDLVRSVGNVNQSNLSIAYTAATAQALPNGTGETQTVTFTITDQ